MKRPAGGSAIYEARRRRAGVVSGLQLAFIEPPNRQGWNTDHWETPWPFRSES